jgi:hypothetical protein
VRSNKGMSKQTPLIEVTVGGPMVHETGPMHPRKDHILQISSNGYLRGLGL